MMQAPNFWTTTSSASRLLRPASWVYGAISGARMRLPPRHRASVPVIAIGNFTAGGSGKTPTAIAITQLAIGLGFSPIVLMRGYGGKARGPMLIDATHDSSIDVGDEALMIARAGLPVIVARDRAAGAVFAISCGCDLIILDDGFQNPTLAKDLSLVVVDSVYGIGNGDVMPAGPLRAPLPVQLEAAHALIIVSSGVTGTGADAVLKQATQAGKPVFSARLEADLAGTDFRDRRIVAFAGIGRPEKLVEGLRARGALVEELVAFPDHHRYRPKEARSLLARVEGTDRLLVTTAKDMVRLSGDPDPAVTALAARAEVAAVRLTFTAEGQLVAFLTQHLDKMGRLPQTAANQTSAQRSYGLEA